MLKLGEEIQKINGWNSYLVVKACENFATLLCISFVVQEDLGDCIYCTGQNQEILIAQWHAPGFELSPF